jgi:hypothetical protein
MKFLLPLFLVGAAAAGTVDVIPVPTNLQKKYTRAADAAQKAGEAMATYCAKLGREIGQNQRTCEFGCLLPEPSEPNPSQQHAERF